METLKKKILAELRSDMNGAVVGSMMDYNGSEPFFSYGVSIVKVKGLAKEYFPNHELALSLFNTKIRELKLFAIYVDNPKETDREQMELWAESFNEHSREIADNASTMLFYASSDAIGVAQEWIGRDDESLIKSGLMMAGKRAKTMREEESQESWLKILDAIGSIKEDNISLSIANAIAFALVYIYKVADTVLEARVKEILNLNHITDYIRSEVEWQL